MAGVQWKGGKCKGGTEAKGKMIHDDKAERLVREHSNPDIDITKTPNNFSYYGLSYAQKCRRYDELVASAKVKKKRTGKNANTTMQSLCIWYPRALQDGENYDPIVLHNWYMDVGDILKERYGDYYIDMDVHVDEIHLYLDSTTKEWAWSLAHGHAGVIPVVMEDGELYLNGKKFASRKEINWLNQAIHEMTLEKYHVPYIDGRGKRPSKSIGRLKAESAKLLMEKEKEVEARERAVETREKIVAGKEKLVQIGREASKTKVSENVNNESIRSRRQGLDISDIHY